MKSQPYTKAALLFVFVLLASGLLRPVSVGAQLINQNFNGGVGTSPDPFLAPGPNTNSSGPTVGKDPTAGVDPKVDATGPNTDGAAPSLPTQEVTTTGPNTETPTFCPAQIEGGSIADIFKYFTCFLQGLMVPTLMALAGLFFFLGMLKFISSGDSEERAEGKQFMIWGVVGFAIIFSVWGLTSLLKDTLSLDNTAPTIQDAGQIQSQ